MLAIGNGLPLIKKLSGCTAGLASFGVSIVIASSQTYSVTDLGPLTELAGQSQSRPNAINAAGRVAAANLVGGEYRALVYAGAWTNLGTLGGSNSYAAGINDSGAVVGYSLNGAGLDHAFLWMAGAIDGVPGNIQMKDLGALGGSSSEAYAINQHGQITGFAQTSKNDHAFKYSAGDMIDIGDLLSSSLPNSYGYGINSAGHIAGTAYNNSFSAAHAFIYDGVNAVDIGSLAGKDASALAINDSDQVAGYATTSGGFEHAFRYSGGVMTDLGSLGGNYSYAIAINNSNVIVGGAFTDPADSVYHAFICTANSMADLNTNLDGTGVGWVLVEARAINDAGQIAGVGTLGGKSHGFLLRPVSQIIQEQPTNFTVACRGDASFAVKAVLSTVFYQWYGGSPSAGLLIPNATNSVLNLTNVTGAQAGFYYVVVSAGLDSVTSAPATLTVLDSTPPVFSGCPTNLTRVTDAGACSAVVTWTNPVAIDACDGVVPVSCVPTNGSQFSKGVTTVICRANDSSGNTNTCAFTVTVVDSSPPLFSGCPSNITRIADAGTCSTMVSWTNPTALDVCGGVVPVICIPTNGSRFSKGVTTVVCLASDADGNTNSCAFNVTVVDQQAPVFAGCLLNQTNHAVGGASIATVTWTNPLATDNCDGVVQVICTPPSGSIFSQGVTTVTCYAYDSSGNTNSCTFKVTVLALQQPLITGLEVIGTGVLVRFASINAAQYSIQAAGNPLGTWTDVLTAIPGNGEVVTVTNLAAAGPLPRFFRVKLSLP